MPRRPKLQPVDALALACRVYPVTPALAKSPRSRRTWQQPRSMLIFDTETRIDATQRLTFGSYRFLVDGDCLEEGLFYADDLPEDDQAILRTYVETHLADVGEAGVWSQNELGAHSGIADCKDHVDVGIDILVDQPAPRPNATAQP